MKTMALVLSLIAISGLSSAQTTSLEPLKAKREADEAKIERETRASYSNALEAALAQLKKEGNLDGYIAVSSEKKRFGDGKTIEEGLSNPNELVAVAAGKAVADNNKRRAELLKSYFAQLEALMKSLVQAEKIEDAKQVKEELAKAQFEVADIEMKLPGKKESPVSVNRTKVACAACNGTGKVSKECSRCNGSSKCSKCNGAGYAKSNFSAPTYSRFGSYHPRHEKCLACSGSGNCPSCKSGMQQEATCSQCNGQGVIVAP